VIPKNRPKRWDLEAPKTKTVAVGWAQKSFWALEIMDTLKLKWQESSLSHGMQFEFRKFW